MVAGGNGDGLVAKRSYALCESRVYVFRGKDIGKRTPVAYWDDGSSLKLGARFEVDKYYRTDYTVKIKK